MNRSRQILKRAGMVADLGAPRCSVCVEPLRFGTDRQGWTTETCACGRRFVVRRAGEALGVHPKAR